MANSIGAQVFTGVVSGIVSLGLMIFVLRQIFVSLRAKVSTETLTPIIEGIRVIVDKKVDQNVYDEYCKRIDENFARGTRQFKELRQVQDKFGETQTEMCIAMVKISENMPKVKP